MLAFHNDPALKEQVYATVLAHREADKLVKGQYWERGKGCAVGCTLEGVKQARGLKTIKHGSHALYESELGIPRILAYLEDRIFERLPNEDSQRWPERFITAIAPGADLALVWPRFALWLLAEELPGKVSDKFPKSTAALADVAALYREWVESGAKPDRERWVAARDDALAARRDAACAATPPPTPPTPPPPPPTPPTPPPTPTPPPPTPPTPGGSLRRCGAPAGRQARRAARRGACRPASGLAAMPQAYRRPRREGTSGGTTSSGSVVRI